MLTLFGCPSPSSRFTHLPKLLIQGWGLQKLFLIKEAASEVVGGSESTWQPLARVMFLLCLLLPVFAAPAYIAEPEPESRRLQIWKNGDTTEEAGNQEVAGNERSLETWRALRTNRQKLRELTWEDFNEKQQEAEGLEQMQV